MNLKKTVVTAVTTLGIAAGGVATAGIASAAPAPAPHSNVYSATTYLPARGDSGDSGNTWATEKITRKLVIKETSSSSIPGVANTFTATVTDYGQFQSYTNETSPAGTHHIGPKAIGGQVVGQASYSFTAMGSPSNKKNLGVPGYENDHGQYVSSGDTSTSLWYEQAFASGTTFGGTGIENNWKWTYDAKHVLTGTKNVPVVRWVRTGFKWELVTVWKNGRHTSEWKKVPAYKKVVTIKKVNQYQNEQWVDAAVNSHGDIYGV